MQLIKPGSQIIVIGAGIVGVSTGLWLSRSGYQVTLIDKQAPGEGTSHGNAGVLASCSMVPVTSPVLISKAPGMLLDKDSPLFLRWSYLPRLAPWLFRYLSHANDKDTRRIASHLHYVVGDSVEQHQDLAGNTEADRWLVPSDYQFAYLSQTDYEADRYAWDIRAHYGFKPEILTGAAVQEREPALSKSVNLLAVVRDHGHILNPGKYVKSLARVFQQTGGRLVQATVRNIELIDGRIRRVHADTGSFACDCAVIASGVWSGELCRQFALNIPMESERGYHIIFRTSDRTLSAPTMIASGKFVATPMSDGLRCAGLVELGGLQAGPSNAPLELLHRQVARTLPGLSYTDHVEWLGHRPAPADSLPFIGQIGHTSVYTAFGHHHIGLTGGPKTGRLLAELISGERTAEELHAFRPDRYSRSVSQVS